MKGAGLVRGREASQAGGVCWTSQRRLQQAALPTAVLASRNVPGAFIAWSRAPRHLFKRNP